jgi:hypothetical protein
MCRKKEIAELTKEPRAAPSSPARLKGGKRRKIEVAIAALLSGQTIKHAALECGMGYRTLKTWLASDWFQTEYQAAKKQLLDSTINQLRTIGSEGVAGLHDVVVNADNPASARVSAARAILEVLLRAVEIQDITTRLERLEAAMGKVNDE